MQALAIKSCLTVLLLLFLFYVASILLEQVLGLSIKSLSERLVYGCFAYFLLFEIVTVPMILFKAPFHYLVSLWLVVIGVICVTAVLLELFGSCGRLAAQGGGLAGIALTAAAVLVVCGLAVSSAFQRYIAWDPGYYIGAMNTTLYTDTMYIYDGADGTPDTVINLRYALSAFYMQFTVWCRLLSIPARTMAWWVMRPLCVLLAGLSVYRIGAEVGREDSATASGLVLLWAGIDFFWTELHTTAYFLFVRGYEAKGYCANVVLPMVLCACIALLRHPLAENGEAWKRLGVVSWASIAISMSSMAIVPACIAVLTLVLLVQTGRVQALRNAFLCVLPNLCIVAIYLLFKLELINIATGRG